MKTLFMIISTLACFYLLAQIPAVKTALVSLVPSQSLGSNTGHSQTNHEQALQNNINSSHEKLSELERQITSLSQQNIALNKQVLSLSKELKSLNAQAQKSDNSKKTVKNEIVSEPTIANLKEIQTSNSYLGNENAQSKRLSTDNAPNSEQTKRLHQQAVLRDLALKMELSALQRVSQ